MKKYFFGVSLILGICMFFTIENSPSSNKNFGLNDFLQFRQAEAEYGDIICSRGSFGRCFERIDTDDELVTYYCQYSGYTTDECYPD